MEAKLLNQTITRQESDPVRQVDISAEIAALYPGVIDPKKFPILATHWNLGPVIDNDAALETGFL